MVLRMDANRVLLIEPSDKYPISDNSMKFMLDLSKNIKNIIIFQVESFRFTNKNFRQAVNIY